jgi:DnaJ-class molecular chaperone
VDKNKDRWRVCGTCHGLGEVMKEGRLVVCPTCTGDGAVLK